MSELTLDDALEGVKASLEDALAARHVSRSLPPDPASLPMTQLRDGVVCLVNEGGGEWATYIGREGELGVHDASVVGFVMVDEKSEPVEIERAELQLLGELLAWCKSGPFGPAEDVEPVSFTQSKQLEHPFGWLVLKLKVRF
jgi:hypothetical protein